MEYGYPYIFMWIKPGVEYDVRRPVYTLFSPWKIKTRGHACLGDTKTWCMILRVVKCDTGNNAVPIRGDDLSQKRQLKITASAATSEVVCWVYGRAQCGGIQTYSQGKRLEKTFARIWCSRPSTGVIELCTHGPH